MPTSILALIPVTLDENHRETRDIKTFPPIFWIILFTNQQFCFFRNIPRRKNTSFLIREQHDSYIYSIDSQSLTETQDEPPLF